MPEMNTDSHSTDSAAAISRVPVERKRKSRKRKKKAVPVSVVTEASERPTPKERRRKRVTASAPTVISDRPREVKRAAKKVKKSAAAKVQVPKKRKKTRKLETDAPQESISVMPKMARSQFATPRLRRSAQRRYIGLEAVGLVCIFLGGILSLSLLTYHRSDPALFRASDGTVENWIGPLGAHFADFLTTLMGVCAFVVPIGFFVYGVLLLRTHFIVPRARHFIGAAIAFVGVAAILDVAIQREVFPFPPGGLLGLLIATALMPHFHVIGTALSGFFLFFFGLFVCVDRPAVVAIREFGLGCRSFADRIIDRLDVYREEQRILKAEAMRAKEASVPDSSANESDELGRSTLVQLLAGLRVKERNRKRAVVRVKKRRTGPSSLEDDSAYEIASADSIAAPLTGEGEPSLSIVTSRPNIQRAPSEVEEVLSVDLDTTEILEMPAVAVQEPAPVSTASVAEPPVHAPIAIPTDLPSPQAAKQSPAGSGAREKGPLTAEASAPAEGLVIVEREDGVQEADMNEDAAVSVAPETPFELPPLRLLDYDAPDRIVVDETKMFSEAEKLMQKFADFGIKGRVREVRPGPVVTTYEFVPAPGIKVSRIAALSDDIAMAMEAIHVRIVAPIPGKGAVGIEIPNERRETVFLKEIIATEQFRKNPEKKLTMALGKDIEGRPYTADLAEMPHVLISGTTGSGKSVSVNAMICSLLYRASPDDVKFLMIDPKMLELSIYDGIPHLLHPPIIDSKKAANALQWAVGEMDRRYKAMSELGVRDITGFNEVIADVRAGKDVHGRKAPTDDKGVAVKRFPFIVIIIDEYADLLAIAGKDVEGYVMRLAQKARAAGIHVMLATQRPSVDVITGVIKANFPVRMGFRLASNHDSKTIINRPGAEKLLGKGDMLIMPPGTSNVTRVHGAYVSEKELHRVVNFIKAQGEPNYDMSIVTVPESEAGTDDGPKEKDVKWDEAVRVVARSRKASTSWLQRQLGVGYNRAARIVEMMEREGLIGPTLSAKGNREIFIPPSAGD